MSVDFVLDFSLNHNHAQNCECLFNKNRSLCMLMVFDDGIGVGIVVNYWLFGYERPIHSHGFMCYEIFHFSTTTPRLCMPIFWAFLHGI
jgi:hypothetical protein